MFTDQELDSFYNSLPEGGRDLPLAEFKRQVHVILDPKRNAEILDSMVEMRHREATARHNKRMIERAQERSRLGLR